MSALKGIRIIEIAHGVAGEYCAKLLADFGAEVIKIEPAPNGSPTRTMAPRLRNEGGIETSGLFAYLNTNKQSLLLDLGEQSGIDELHSLLETADILVDDHSPDWLASIGIPLEEIESKHPSLIVCSITPYGPASDKGRWNAKSLNVFHDSGWGYHTPSAADPARPPLKGPGRFLVEYDAGLEAAICTVSSLYWRRQSAAGQRIDVSARDVMISRADLVLGRLLAGEDEPGSRRSAYDQPGPAAFFPCADGHVYLYMTNQKHWRGLSELMGNPQWMADYDENWLEFGVTPEKVAEVRAEFKTWIGDKTKDEISEQAQQLGVPLVSVNDAADLHRSPQYQYREFFKPLTHPTLGEALYPTVPYRMTASPASLAKPAPALDEHDAGVFDIPHRDALSQIRSTSQTSPRRSKAGPLSGVRVVEITKVWAGPFAGKLLAFLGAEVIKIESLTNLDELRGFGGVDPDYAPYFLSVNQEILSVQANMKTDQGRAYVRDMIASSDIVLNNLRPGAMERLGMAYEQLAAIKPDIIAVSMKMFGNDGPLGHQTGYAPCFSALGGLSQLVGYEGEQPLGINMRYGDSTVGVNAVFASVVALMHREKTGEGQFVDLSAVECMSSMAGDSLLEYSLTGQVPTVDGHRHSEMAPHGCYPCLDNEWISIAVESDDEWRRLCESLSCQDLLSNPAYRDLENRQENCVKLDAQLSELTRSLDASELAESLRSAGVAANKSLSTLDLIADETLWNNETFRMVSDRRNGQRPIVGPGWRMSKTAPSITRGAPRLGEHNEYVYGEILGLSTEKIAQLIAEQIIY